MKPKVTKGYSRPVYHTKVLRYQGYDILGVNSYVVSEFIQLHVVKTSSCLFFVIHHTKESYSINYKLVSTPDVLECIFINPVLYYRNMSL